MLSPLTKAHLIKIEVVQDDRKVSREKTFYMAGAVASEIIEFTEKERKYYDFIDYIATKKELEFYRSLTDVGKKEFLGRFWFRIGKDALRRCDPEGWQSALLPIGRPPRGGESHRCRRVDEDRRDLPAIARRGWRTSGPWQTHVWFSTGLGGPYAGGNRCGDEIIK